MHTLVCRVFKWNYELLYGQTILPTDIGFASANAPLNNDIQNVTSVILYLSQSDYIVLTFKFYSVPVRLQDLINIFQTRDRF